MTEINLNPDNNVTPASASVFNGNKGLLIAIALGLIAVVIGVSTLIGFKSTGKFEGMIKRVETETAQLQNSTK
ncbi:MAG: hypothetical protein AAB953_03270 [Patescibacteria group bacterium]